MSSQESVEDLVSDTPPLRRGHPNGSSDGSVPSPSKKQKRKKHTRTQFCKDTVKEDTAQVMRIFLIRSESVTEDDLEEDLETDAGPDDSADESEREKEILDAIANRLKQMGDEVQKKYQKDPEQAQALNDLVPSLIRAQRDQAYNSFRDTLKNFCDLLCGNDPNTDSLAFVFYLTRRVVEASKEAGRKIEESMEFGQRYVNDVYGAWIEQNGGWGQVLGEGTAI